MPQGALIKVTERNFVRQNVDGGRGAMMTLRTKRTTYVTYIVHGLPTLRKGAACKSRNGEQEQTIVQENRKKRES